MADEPTTALRAMILTAEADVEDRHTEIVNINHHRDVESEDYETAKTDRVQRTATAQGLRAQLTKEENAILDADERMAATAKAREELDDKRAQLFPAYHEKHEELKVMKDLEQGDSTNTAVLLKIVEKLAAGGGRGSDVPTNSPTNISSTPSPVQDRTTASPDKTPEETRESRKKTPQSPKKRPSYESGDESDQEPGNGLRLRKTAREVKEAVRMATARNKIAEQETARQAGIEEAKQHAKAVRDASDARRKWAEKRTK
ncbi:hypothetical protein LTR56_015139 [Elasticomyces elasticus]|nr:hypothetical protein LTR56_015139 [Elasticomyces elasticus]KAK3651981.1 hypothetical protein LTR22_011911 [Elasticomyces elasticus]KAK4919066.1 hypothetical protein LTR49_013237 [Elasticomyces elasticus]KAK5765702.1 hypothetical protein LTS12_004208 [Elasticomyces elasticus]